MLRGGFLDGSDFLAQFDNKAEKGVFFGYVAKGVFQLALVLVWLS
jgi:hypothetical protein